jgi:membrane fusion protein (multidrug efflux system)
MIQRSNSVATGNRNSRTLLSFAISAVLAVLVSVAVTGCSRSEGKTTATSPGPIPVSVVKVHQGNVPLTSNWVGTLDGFVNAQIQPQVSGYLIRQNYREGSPVAKDQVLFQIDRVLFRL